MVNLILLEDETVLRDEVADFLREQGHVVDTAGSLAEFDSTFRPGIHLIALIDLGLPDGEGLALIARLRAHGERLGIIIVTARNSSANRVAGLTGGADYYVAKPFDLDELAASIISLERRLLSGGVSLHWVLNERQRTLTPPGRAPIDLTSQSFLVLKAIVVGGGKPVDRRTIVESIGENYLQHDPRRLDTQLHQIRKSVVDASGLELPVRTARGRGYQITENIDLRG